MSLKIETVQFEELGFLPERPAETIQAAAQLIAAFRAQHVRPIRWEIGSINDLLPMALETARFGVTPDRTLWRIPITVNETVEAGVLRLVVSSRVDFVNAVREGRSAEIVR